MPIKVFSDRIELGDTVITAVPTGIRIGRSLSANTQNLNTLATSNFTAQQLAYGNFVFQGSIAGYAARNIIEKFPFATSTTNATNIGSLTTSRININTGHSSATHGYASGGYAPPGNAVNNIDKFSFFAGGNATDVGDLATAVYNASGQSSSVNGYTSAGTTAPPTNTPTAAIQKFSFASEGNATSIGNLTVSRRTVVGQSSKTHGYASGGNSPIINTIDKFPFVSDTNATDVGDLTQARSHAASQSSTTHGYASGGESPSIVNTIDKFPFSSDSNATDVGDLTQARGAMGTAQSSTTHGYTSGGFTSGGLNTIDRFPFSADTNASDVGDLSNADYYHAGSQV